MRLFWGISNTLKSANSLEFLGIQSLFLNFLWLILITSALFLKSHRRVFPKVLLMSMHVFGLTRGRRRRRRLSVPKAVQTTWKGQLLSLVRQWMYSKGTRKMLIIHWPILSDFWKIKRESFLQSKTSPVFLLLKLDAAAAAALKEASVNLSPLRIL